MSGKVAELSELVAHQAPQAENFEDLEIQNTKFP